MKRLLILLLCLFMLPAAALANAADTYEEAENLLAEQAYEEAAELYDSIITYRDAAKCGMYARALAALDAGRLEDARSVFAHLGDFKDCDMLCAYLDILQMEADGAYAEAIDACEVMPYAAYGRMVQKHAELKERFEFRRYANAEIVDGCVLVKHAQTGLWGVIDRRGQVIVPCEWDELYAGSGEYFIAGKATAEGYKYGVVSALTGKTTVPYVWDEIEAIASGFAVVGSGENYRDRVYGIVSVKTGETVLPCEWNNIELHVGGYALLCNWSNESNVYRLIGLPDGRVIIDDAEYVELWTPDIGGVYALAPDGKLHGFEGDLAAHPKSSYAGMEVFDTLLALATFDPSGEHARFYITENRCIDVAEADFVEHYLPKEDTEFGCSILETDGKYGCADQDGRQVLACEWDHIQILSSTAAVCFKGELKYGWPSKGESFLIDLENGKAAAVNWMISSVSYGTTQPERQYVVRNDEGYGVIDAAGREIVPCRMADIEPLEDGYLRVMDASRKYGIYSAFGEEIFPCEYRRVDYADGIYVLIAYGEDRYDSSSSTLTIMDEDGHLLF